MNDKSQTTDDLVDRLWASDAASVLTNQAAREIERLRAYTNQVLRANDTLSGAKWALATRIDRLEKILRKIVDQADEGKGSPRLEQIRMLAVYAVERVIREDCNNV